MICKNHSGQLIFWGGGEGQHLPELCRVSERGGSAVQRKNVGQPKDRAFHQTPHYRQTIDLCLSTAAHWVGDHGLETTFQGLTLDTEADVGLDDSSRHSLALLSGVAWF